MSLLDRFGMDEAERRRRQEFLALGADDADNLRALRPVFAAEAQRFAEKFYEHLLADEHTARLLVDPGQLEYLKRVQSEYFAELLEGVFDAAYYEKRLRVGQAHQRVGLEPVYYLGAYNQYVQLTFPLFARAFGPNLERALPHLLSLVKVIFLDVGLALDTYFHEATEQLRRRNDELQQALGMYMQAQRREEQLRKLLSHEVRGGLAAVITTLEDLLDVLRPSLDPGSVEQLENVGRRCWSLSALLGEMLATARAGGPAWVDTAGIFESLVARFGLYTEGRAIHLVLPPHPPRVWADPLQLREVFANLVANAVRYLDKEPGRVEISCRPVSGAAVEIGPPDAVGPASRAGPVRLGSPDLPPATRGERHPDGEFYLFCVADNGPGIPAVVRPRLFEPFVRGPGVEGRSEGSGLGLYFVRTIVEQGGGRIWVESTPGVGSCFWFTVPRAPLGAAPGGVSPSPRTPNP
jgi:signal transduction histidine kinase